MTTICITPRKLLLFTLVLSGSFFACKKKDNATSNADFKNKQVLVYTDSTLVVSVPTAFTPNGDGINDVFSVVGSGITNTHFQLTVATLGGQTVFQTSDHTARWDGRNSSGTKLTDYKYNVSISFSTPEGKNVDTSTYLYLVPTNTAGCIKLIPADTASYVFPDQINTLTGQRVYNTNEIICL